MPAFLIWFYWLLSVVAAFTLGHSFARAKAEAKAEAKRDTVFGAPYE